MVMSNMERKKVQRRHEGIKLPFLVEGRQNVNPSNIISCLNLSLNL